MIESDPEHNDRLSGFILRREIVAVTHVEQRDEPPGRGPFRRQEIVLAKSEVAISRDKVPTEIAITVRNLPGA